MRLQRILVHRTARLVVMLAAPAIALLVELSTGWLPAVLLASAAGAAAKIFSELAVDVHQLRRGHEAHVAAATELRSQVASLEMTLHDEHATVRDALEVIHGSLQDLRERFDTISAEVVSSAEQHEAASARLSDLSGRVDEFIDDVKGHAVAHAGDDSLRALLGSVDRLLSRWREDQRSAPVGTYGPPEARLARSIAGLSQRLRWPGDGPDST